jgi:hypothetical protein
MVIKIVSGKLLGRLERTIYAPRHKGRMKNIRLAFKELNKPWWKKLWGTHGPCKDKRKRRDG